MVDGYLRTGHAVRWVSSRIPPDAPKQTGATLRVDCWNFMETVFGIPWPIWTGEGFRALHDLVSWADVVHVQDCAHFCSGIAVLLAERESKPVILSQHIGFIEYRKALPKLLLTLLYRTLGKMVLEKSTRVVFCNLSAEEYLTQTLKIRHSHLQTIGCAVDTDQFHPAQETQERRMAKNALGLPQDKPLILFVGRLTEKKRPDLFLALSRAKTGAHFLIVGDGPLRAQARGPNVTWIPYLPAERMPEVYRAGDALVLPSYGEGLPLVVLEAMAAGLPVVLSDAQTYAKVLAQEGLCFAVRPEPEALKRCLDFILDDAQTMGHMAKQAREYVVEHHGLAATSTAYAEIVAALVNRPTYANIPANV